VRFKNMFDTPKKSISTRNGWLIALAIAAGMLLSAGKPTSAFGPR
jgi:hypothetical protein